MLADKLAEEECQDTGIAHFIKKGWAKSQVANTTLAYPKAELLCRYNLSKNTGENSLSKKPTLTGNHRVPESQLDHISTDSKTICPLWFASK